VSFIFLGVYVLVGVAYEISAICFWEKIRKVLKLALLPVLFISYFVTAANMLIVTLIAILFGWLGDILLLRKDEPKYFNLGLAAFLLSHVFYIVTFILITKALHIPALAASICIALAAVILMQKIVNPPKAMLGPVFAYGLVISAMSICALQYMLADISLYPILVFAGSIFFLFSDMLLSYYTFGKKSKYLNAIPMLPYIIAQGLIIFGLSG
jgi:uncharacterized membrane protein YhhN